MADKPDKQAKSKRIVRNPDTFRERALKATEADAQPGLVGKARQTVAKPFKPAAGAVSHSFGWKIVSSIFKFIGKGLRFIVPKYLRNSWKELKLVTWPNWKQSRQLTGAVLIFAIVFGASIALVDYGLDKLFRNILLK
jgi:preprotein translocase SecE subunit